MNIDLSSIADETLTAILSKRFAGCGENMPHAAADIRAIADRLRAALEAQGLSAATLAGRRAFYRGGLAPRSDTHNRRVSGGLVAFVGLRFGNDGCSITVDSLETAAVRSGSPEMFVADIFNTPPTTWIEDRAAAKLRGRRLN
jgi:hypothetical protein